MTEHSAHHEHGTHHDHPDRGGVSEAGWRRIAAWARETADVAKLDEPAIPDNLQWLRRRHAELTARIGTSAGGAFAAASFDALAHAVTVEGDWPRCAGCGDYGSHQQCQPEELAAGGGAL